MSAEKDAAMLHEAGRRISEELCYGGSGHEFYGAVATLLHMAADHAKGRGSGCPSCVEQTVNVAQAYLGTRVTPTSGDDA